MDLTNRQHKIKNLFSKALFLKQNQVKKISQGFPLSRSFVFSKAPWFKRDRKTFGKTNLEQKFTTKKHIRFFNKKGQGLIEYLILVALMGVATIGIIRTLNQTVKSRFANAVYALQGRSQKAKIHNMKKTEYQRSDLSDFMSGSASTDKKKKSQKRRR